MTPTELRQIAPTVRASMVSALCDAFERQWPKYQIDTPERQAHFVAQAAHETAGFTTLEELGRPAYFKRYDPNTTTGKRLGNVKAGDGYLFRGRGIFQLTGRANYAAYGAKLKLDLIEDPDAAAIPENSVRIACEYWKARGLNAWADRDDCKEITRRINGGSNGLAERLRYLARAKDVLGAGAPPVSLLSAEEMPDGPIALEPPKSWFSSRINQAAAGIGSISGYGLYEQAKDFAYSVADDPAQVAIAFVKEHPSAVIILGLVAYIIWTRVQMLKAGS